MPKVQQRHVQAVCDRLLERLAQSYPKVAKALSKATYSEPYASLTAKEKNLAKVRILAEQHTVEFDEVLNMVLRPQESPRGITRSSLASFLANMPRLRGAHYQEASGGNYKKL